jgi:hypothetical protein
MIAGIGIAGGNDCGAAIRLALNEAGIGPTDIGHVFASSGLTMPALLANRANGAPRLTVAEEMTGSCGGASAAVQLACALLEPLETPAVILTSDETGTFAAMTLLPWQQ